MIQFKEVPDSGSKSIPDKIFCDNPSSVSPIYLETTSNSPLSTDDDKVENMNSRYTPIKNDMINRASVGSGSVITNRTTEIDLAASESRLSLDSFNLAFNDTSQEIFVTPKIDCELGSADDLEKGQL